MQKYSGNIVPENGEEELLMMAGRINALEGYLNNSQFVDREVVASIMGFQLKSEEKKEADELKNRGLLGIIAIKENK